MKPHIKKKGGIWYCGYPKFNAVSNRCHKSAWAYWEILNQGAPVELISEIMKECVEPPNLYNKPVRLARPSEPRRARGPHAARQLFDMLTIW